MANSYISKYRSTNHINKRDDKLGSKTSLKVVINLAEIYRES